MSEAPYYLIFALLHVVVPAVGVFAAGMLAVGPASPAKRWVALVYAAIAGVVAAWYTIEFWWPGDAWWNGFHLFTVALCGVVVALVGLQGRARLGARTARVLRPLVVGCLFVSAVALFFLVGGGSGK